MIAWFSVRQRAVWMLVLLAVLAAGCSRTRYRLNADREGRELIDEHSNDPRWTVRNFNLNYDPRSRYFEPNNQDHIPMPPDDPAAHQYMHYVSGKRGWKYWHRWGDQQDLQAPQWRELLGTYLPTTEDGGVKLDLDGAVQLALIHSPDYRTQLETLFLSALDVSTERFRFVTQFFGGLGPTFTETGPVLAGAGTGASVLGVSTAPAATDPNFGVAAANTGTQPTNWRFTKSFATGGQAVVGFANAFVWNFAGNNTDAATSLLSFSFIQPLLRAGGRAVSLEQLTIVERTLLANMRAMQRYRQGFFTNIAVGDFSGITGPQRVGGFSGGTGLTGFTGQGSAGLGGVGAATNIGRAGFSAATNQATGAIAGTGFAGGNAGQVGGFVGLLQQLQQVRNTEDSLNLQLRTLALLEANLQAGVIDITQVDTFRQNIETERANLLAGQINLENAKDTFKRQIIGLPPDLDVEIDDTMLKQFQFIDPAMRKVEYRYGDFVKELSEGESAPAVETLAKYFDEFESVRPEVVTRFGEVQEDLKRLELAIPERRKLMTPEEVPLLEAEQVRLKDQLADLEKRFEATAGEAQRLRGELTEATREKITDALVAQAVAMQRLVAELSLVEARARLESIVIEPIELESPRALEVARYARLDWMNNRATVVNTWRLITFNANALRSNLTVSFSGNLGTVRDNAVSFDPKNGDLIGSVRFDPPFTRLLERNNYRQSLINYQQDRRTLIQFEDSINQTLRQDLRVLRQLRINLEIQRRAVTIAVRRVDKTLEDLSEPPAPVLPGQQAEQLASNAAFNLLTAISDLRNAQNNFLSVWMNYYSERMQLQRDLGIMQIDDRGMWIDEPVEDVIAMVMEGAQPVEELPPPVPVEWLQDAGFDLNRPLDEQMHDTEPAPPEEVPAENPVRLSIMR
ncbi:MAG TPA: TolC family protein [Pirellulales bacterium]|nr:TolC family protein [Pirellulales bacterium]